MYIEASAKTGENVIETFEKVTEQVLHKVNNQDLNISGVNVASESTFVADLPSKLRLLLDYPFNSSNQNFPIGRNF